MKKKLVLITAAVLAILCLCLCACNLVSDKLLSRLSEMMRLDYSAVEIGITSTTDGLDLNGEFTLTFDDDAVNVKYRYDKLNSFGTDFDLTAPDEWKTTVSGEAVVKDGEIVQGDANAELPFDAISFNGFSFKQAFFDNVKVSASRFEADVVNPQGFVGNNNFVCSDMHVNVKFGDYIGRLEITYVSANGSDITLVYNFTR